MDPEDYPSDSDASDEDFRPDRNEDESASEIDSDDNVEDNDAAADENGDSKKRKRKVSSKPTAGKKKPKPEVAKVTATADKDSDKEDKELDEDEEERLTDALWADFLSDSGTSASSASASKPKASPKAAPKATTVAVPKKPAEVPKTTSVVTKIFEFAGEAVEVTEEVPTKALATVSSNINGGPAKPLQGPPTAARAGGGSGGLGAVLSQIGKKNKLSTLEKTKLDWNSFKRTQGLEEELKTHNKGKDGYLERQDFLQRADVRQFEIEKSFRQTTRSNR